jgi:ArsR family transcriptional regulator
VLAALGDPVRLRLFSIVAAEGEVCSFHLEGPLGKSQPTISHHTTVLAEAGLIAGEKRGKWTWWRVTPGRLATVRALLGGS